MTVSTLVRIPMVMSTFLEKLYSPSTSKYVVPPTNNEALLHRIAQVNHNTKVKLTKFPAAHTEHVEYQLLLHVSRACERLGMRTRVVEFGPLPVLAPNFSSARGIAISSGVTASIPTKEPYKLDAQLRAPEYIPELLRILKKISPDLNIPSAKDLNQGQVLMKKPVVRAMSKIVAPVERIPRGGLSEPGGNKVPLTNYKGH